MIDENIHIYMKGRSAILQCSKELFKVIREHFSIKNPNYMSRRFNPRLYSITPGGAFLPGMWYEIENYIKSLNIFPNITFDPLFEKQLQPSLSLKTIEKLPIFDYHEYQSDTIESMFNNGRGIILLATGAGKTGIVGGFCKTFLKNNPNAKILITTPTPNLMEQLYSDFTKKFDIQNISRWGNKNQLDLSKNIIVSNAQMATYDLDASIKIFKNFDVVIVDEVHTLAGKDKAVNLIGKLVHNLDTPNKFGLTATLPQNLIETWGIIGKIGPILYEKNSYEIRKMGNITEVEVRVVVCNHNKVPKFIKETLAPTELYDKELNYIINNSTRNNLISNISCSLVLSNILIVVDRVDHGNNLLDEISKVNGKDKTFFISGEMDTDERERIFQMMENDTGIICIAMSKIFSTGISINNLHYCIFALIGKSSIKVIQTIGRTVRKHESKDKAVIFDIADNLYYSRKHLTERLKIYKDQKIDFSIKNVKI